ncbi:hypothetical protein DL771_009006 [Monosporascus sp. 5C6A]|nr:hypothetical protein DL771_009006 [Monosporascus sp. 5C6A]
MQSSPSHPTRSKKRRSSSQREVSQSMGRRPATGSQDSQGRAAISARQSAASSTINFEASQGSPNFDTISRPWETRDPMANAFAQFKSRNPVQLFNWETLKIEEEPWNIVGAVMKEDEADRQRGTVCPEGSVGSDEAAKGSDIGGGEGN